MKKLKNELQTEHVYDKNIKSNFKMSMEVDDDTIKLHTN